jgi:SAM-dependent methyltransferase
VQRRHPSAGNLDQQPGLVADDAAADAIPPAAFPWGTEPRSGHIELGPGLDPEVTEKLLGHLEGKRILELGCGTGEMAITLARAGAKVIAIDSDLERISEARETAEIAEINVEFHHGDLADLAFVRNEQIDLAISVYALSGVSDPDRVLRQVHRVLRSDAPFLFSVAHPLSLMARLEPGQSVPTLGSTAFDQSTIDWASDGETGVSHPHRIGDLVTSMARSNFRVDLVSEPRSSLSGESPYATPLAEWVPTTLIIRGRKIA